MKLATFLLAVLSSATLASAADEPYYQEFTRCRWTLDSCASPQVREFFRKHCAEPFAEEYPSDFSLSIEDGTNVQAASTSSGADGSYDESLMTVQNLGLKLAGEANKIVLKTAGIFHDTTAKLLQVEEIKDKANDMKGDDIITDDTYNLVKASSDLVKDANDEAEQASKDAYDLYDEVLKNIEDANKKDAEASERLLKAEEELAAGDEDKALQEIEEAKKSHGEAEAFLEESRDFYKLIIQEDRKATVAKITANVETMQASKHTRVQETVDIVLSASVLSAQAAFASLDTITVDYTARANMETIKQELRICEEMSKALDLSGDAKNQFKELYRAADSLHVLGEDYLKESHYYIDQAGKNLVNAIAQEEKAADKMESSGDADAVQKLLGKSTAFAAEVMTAAAAALQSASSASTVELEAKMALEQIQNWLETTGSARRLRGRQNQGTEQRRLVKTCPDYCRYYQDWMCLAVCPPRRRRRGRRLNLFDDHTTFTNVGQEFCEVVNISEEALVQAIEADEQGELSPECQQGLLEGSSTTEVNKENIIIEWCVAVEY